MRCNARVCLAVRIGTLGERPLLYDGRKPDALTQERPSTLVSAAKASPGAHQTAYSCRRSCRTQKMTRKVPGSDLLVRALVGQTC
jgi:hypothetical protein